MVPWSQMRQPFLGWLRTDLTSEFTHFNLVIHLSNAKQMALRLRTFFAKSCCSGGPTRTFVNCIPLWVKPVRTAKNFIFTAAASAFEVQHDMCDRRQQACPFPAGVVSLVSGEVEHIVHLIRWNLNGCLCHCGATWQRSRRGVTHDL